LTCEPRFEYPWAMRRVNRYRVLSESRGFRILRILADRVSRLWNAAQFLSRQRYLAGEPVPSYAELCATFQAHASYKALPSDVAQETLKKVRESWEAYFETLRAYREGRVHNPPSLPGYWKDRKTGHRLIRCIPIKHPRSYRIADGILEISLPPDLRGPEGTRLRLHIRGTRRWHGKEGRLELVWDSSRRTWYASQSVEVQCTAHTERPRKFAAVDRGARVPMALAVEGSQEAWVFRSRELWKDYRSLACRIHRLQALLATRGQHTSRKLRRLFGRRRGRVLAAYRALARTVVRILQKAKVTDLLMGDLTGIREDMDFGRLNELVHNFWSFRELASALLDACERAGIRVHPVPEQGTSSHCAVCGQNVVRPLRSRVRCPAGHEIHADVNGALNLLYREPEVRARAEGRPRWCTYRWNGHRWVPTESARRPAQRPGSLQAAPAA
jgi:putative transposase